ncbi:hypothetical protein [Bacillus oleivorans]|uniref:hypothetical protein n=1 Tax=Bacillus oleivorans TaxID=1448271 RepID=UPI0015C8ECC2
MAYYADQGRPFVNVLRKKGWYEELPQMDDLAKIIKEVKEKIRRERLALHNLSAANPN